MTKPPLEKVEALFLWFSTSYEKRVHQNFDTPSLFCFRCLPKILVQITQIIRMICFPLCVYRYSLQSVRRMSPLRASVSCMPNTARKAWLVCPFCEIFR